MPRKRCSTGSLNTTIRGTKFTHNVIESSHLCSCQGTQRPIDHGNPRLVQDLRRADGHRSALRTWLPRRWRCCCPSCLSCSRHNFVGLTPSTLADDRAVPVLQGRPPVYTTVTCCDTILDTNRYHITQCVSLRDTTVAQLSCFMPDENLDLNVLHFVHWLTYMPARMVHYRFDPINLSINVVCKS